LVGDLNYQKAGYQGHTFSAALAYRVLLIKKMIIHPFFKVVLNNADKKSIVFTPY